MKLSPELLLEAYRIGVFPMAESRDGLNIVWMQPQLRGVIPLHGFRPSRSLLKKVRRDLFDVHRDRAFPAVIAACASAAAGRDETWINDEIRRAYTGLFEAGHAHSVECWREGKLVGGLYGVSIGGAFFGESMFSFETDASKVALCHLVARLKFGGYQLLDTQFTTPHLVSLGAEDVPQERYERDLARALHASANFAALPDQMAGASIAQLITQTS